MIEVTGGSGVREFFRWRLSYFCGADFLDDLPDLLTIAMCALFARSSFFVGIVSLRTMCNGWLTTRRLVRGAQRCILGCSVGGDDVRHYFGCPAVLATIASQAARPSAWAHPGPIRCALSYMGRRATSRRGRSSHGREGFTRFTMPLVPKSRLGLRTIRPRPCELSPALSGFAPGVPLPIFWSEGIFSCTARGVLFGLAFGACQLQNPSSA